MAKGTITTNREYRGRLAGAAEYTLTVKTGSYNFLFIAASSSTYSYMGIITTNSAGNTQHIDIIVGSSTTITNGTNKITVSFNSQTGNVTAYFLSIPINGAPIMI